MRRSTSASTTASVPSWSSIRAQRLERVEPLPAHVVDGSGRPRRPSPRGPGTRRRRSRRCRRAARRAATSGRAASCPWSWSCSAGRADAGVAQRVDAAAAIASCVSRPAPACGRRRPRTRRAGRTRRARRELDDVVEAVDRLEARAAVLALDEPRDVLVEHPWRSRAGMTSMPCSPWSRRDVAVVEQPLRAGQPERGAGDHDRLGRGARPPPAPPSARAALDELVEQAPELVAGAGAAAARAGGTGDGAPAAARGVAVAPARSVAPRGRGPGPRPAGGPQAAQRGVERGDVPASDGWWRGSHLVVAEHVGGEALQRALRADLDEDRAPCS